MPKAGYPLVVTLAEAATDLQARADQAPFVLIALPPQTDRVATQAIVAEAKKLACLDPLRLFVLGHGAGTVAALRLACESSLGVAAVATVAGSLRGEPCRVPWLDMRGDSDRCVPPASTSALEAWRVGNHCDKQTRVVRKTGDATCHSFDHCALDVQQCILFGVGHIWGSIEACGGKEPSGFNVGDWAWSFFQGHPRKL